MPKVFTSSFYASRDFDILPYHRFRKATSCSEIINFTTNPIGTI